MGHHLTDHYHTARDTQQQSFRDLCSSEAADLNPRRQPPSSRFSTARDIGSSSNLGSSREAAPPESRPYLEAGILEPVPVALEDRPT